MPPSTGEGPKGSTEPGSMVKFSGKVTFDPGIIEERLERASPTVLRRGAGVERRQGRPLLRRK